ncbi:MAG TPA: ABC transporter ATP-binding protein, partial [Gemmatimonadales bacterium]|nr:ABC transporter ATP-binding protein [Gemmatimonadales bacterium]
VLAADDVTLHVAPGETLALIGPNGSGKTTLLKALVGLVRPSMGRVEIAGLDATTGGAAARRATGYLPQRPGFQDGVTARALLRLCARLRGVPARPAEELLDRVGLADAADRVVDGFSGGMRQRLGLAVALVGTPPALVLDEPSAALDPTGALLVRDLIRELRREGTTVLLSSHDLAEVASVADRVAVFSAGRMRAVGSVYELENATGARSIEDVYRCLTGQMALRRVA